MLDYNSIVKKRNEVISLCNEEHLCIRIDATTTTDDMNEWMHESVNELQEAQANLTESIEDTIQSSEEPKAKFVWEGKPRCI